MGSVFRQYFFCLLAAVLGLPLGQAATVTFEVDVRPILKAHCFHCHGEDGSAKGGLDVRLRKLLLKGGKHGPAIVPGQAEKSLFYTKIRDGEMPKEQAKLPAAQIETLRRWIEQGAETARPEPDSPDEWITDEERRFWAFQPIKNPPVPGGTANPIDAFLLETLRPLGQGFARHAQPRTRFRRAASDLLGLPPGALNLPPPPPAGDETTDWWPRSIDALLASPHYGEAQGRDWLDLVRYAETDGFNADAIRPLAYRYRDYVIRAFNQDRAYSRFVQEQIAGDELFPEETEAIVNEAIHRTAAAR